MSRVTLWISKTITLALIIALVCQSSIAQGQGAAGDWTRVQDLAVDTAISVKTRAGAKYHGALVGVTADSLAIDSEEATISGRIVRRREFKREAVREIRLVKPVTSVLAGAGIGAGIGAGVGVSIDAGAKVNGYRVPLALLIAAAGAAVGAACAVHAPFIKGKKIYVAL
jgi:hypothetical protein